MRALHYGAFETVLYKRSKARFLESENKRGPIDEFSLLLLSCGLQQEEANNSILPFAGSVASRCRHGKMPVNEDIAWYFVRNENCRNVVISNIKSKILPLITEGSAETLIIELCRLVEKDTTIDYSLKTKFYQNANEAGLPEFLADLLIYVVQVDPREPVADRPVSIANLPPRNMHYIERCSEIEVLENRFIQGSPIQILSGSGGMGKTQIALHYAYQNVTDYDFIWWVDGDNSHSISQSYAKFLQSRGISCAILDEHAIIVRFREYLNNCRNWLLIYDNCDYMSAEDRGWFLSCLPNYEGAGRIIITSRNPFLIPGVSAIMVGTFAPETALEFFALRTGLATDEFARSIALRLDGYPLALEMAGSYIRVTPGMNFKGYLQLLKKYGIELLNASEDEVSYKYTITKMTEMAFNRIVDERHHDEHSKALVTLAKCTALGSGGNIGIEGFRYLNKTSYDNYAIDEVDEQTLDDLFSLGKICGNTLSRNKLFQIISKYSLLQTEEFGPFSMHAVQKEAILALMSEKEIDDYASALCAAFLQYRNDGISSWELADCDWQLFHYFDWLIKRKENDADPKSMVRCSFLRVRKLLFKMSAAYISFQQEDESLVGEKRTSKKLSDMRNLVEALGECAAECYQALESFDKIANENKPAADIVLGGFPTAARGYYTNHLNLLCGCLVYAIMYDRITISYAMARKYVEILKMLSRNFDFSKTDENTVCIWQKIQMYESHIVGFFAMALYKVGKEGKYDLTESVSDYVHLIESFSDDIRKDLDMTRYYKLKLAWEQKNPHNLDFDLDDTAIKLVASLHETREKLGTVKKS